MVKPAVNKVTLNIVISKKVALKAHGLVVFAAPRRVPVTSKVRVYQLSSCMSLIAICHLDVNHACLGHENSRSRQSTLSAIG